MFFIVFFVVVFKEIWDKDEVRIPECIGLSMAVPVACLRMM